VLVAPDSFKGTFSAPQVAGAIGRGLERAGLMPPDLCPVADGGEGTLDALLPQLGGELVAVEVQDPLGREIRAGFGLVEDGGTAIVEMASASGLGLVAEDERDAWAASTYGTGQLIAAAAEAGAQVILVAVGGSATTDGGLGALEALDFDLRGADVVVACDVTTTFVDAARVFGPQKGAEPDDVAELERRLERLAEHYREARGADVHDLPGAGAAGGLAGGLAAYGARLVPGAALVADVVGLRDAAQGASLVLTGEGRLDATSFAGKVVGHVLDEARALGVPVGIVAGDTERGATPEGVPCLTLVELGGSVDRALADASPLAADAAAELSRTL
jgi:glycerate kinase